MSDGVNFVLGNRVRDKITGFHGIATSRVEYLHGCVQYGVTPQVGTDGKAVDTCYYDAPRLEYVDDGVTIKPAATGGPGNRSELPPR